MITLNVGIKQIETCLVDISGLKPHEDHDFQHSAGLVKAIRHSRYWTTPIIIDQHTAVILDGHHRFAAAKKLDLDRIPAFVVNYDDSDVTLSSWRDGVFITKDDVIRAGTTGELIPKKTSRHAFSFPLPSCRISIDELRKSEAA